MTYRCGFVRRTLRETVSGVRDGGSRNPPPPPLKTWEDAVRRRANQAYERPAPRRAAPRSSTAPHAPIAGQPSAARTRTPVWYRAPRCSAGPPQRCRTPGYAAMAALPGMESLVPNVQAILLLDGDGRRIVAKYRRGARQWDRPRSRPANCSRRRKRRGGARRSDVIPIDKSVAVLDVDQMQGLMWWEVPPARTSSS